MTQLKAIRKYCLWCSFTANEVKLCPVKTCPLFSFRLGKRKIGVSSLKAIKKNCANCGEGTAQSARKCDIKECPLFPYRMGKNPALQGLLHKRGRPFKKRSYGDTFELKQRV